MIAVLEFYKYNQGANVDSVGILVSVFDEMGTATSNNRTTLDTYRVYRLVFTCNLVVLENERESTV